MLFLELPPECKQAHPKTKHKTRFSKAFVGLRPRSDLYIITMLSILAIEFAVRSRLVHSEKSCVQSWC